MEVATTIVLVVLIYFLAQWCLKTRRYVNLMRIFPHPPTVPIIGNTFDLISPKNFIPKFNEYHKLYGDKVKIYIGLQPSKLITCDIRLVGHILSSSSILHKGDEYQYFSKWLGSGLLLTDGDEKWKTHRKLIGPAFHIQILKDFINVFEDNAKTLMDKLKSKLDSNSFDIYSYITLCSLDIICESAMGISINSQSNSNSSYVKYVKFMCKLLVKRAFNVFLRNDLLYMLSSLSREEKRAINTLHNYTDDVIKKRKQYYQRSVAGDVDEIGKKKKRVLLDLLLQENEVSKTFTDVELRQEIDTFLFAGHDTTASALSFAIFALAENPFVQDKVMEEIHEIFGDHITRSVTYQDLQEMKYLEAVIKETLRIYPPVPFFSRTLKKEFDFDGYTLPVGLSIILNIYGIHHNPNLFPDPEVFRPERFLKENMEESYNYKYFPFSSGPRNCIGQKFAILEIKTILSVLLRHYVLLPAVPVHKPVLSAETVLLSTNGIHIRISKRKIIE